MTQAKLGDTVKVHYTGKLEDGKVFDSSADRGPLEFTLGENVVIPGFEESVVGMEIGESITAEIPVDKGYGPRREDMILEITRDRLPEDMEPAVGESLFVRLQDGRELPVKIADVVGETVKLDANHPLAGQPLVFDIELVEIV
jgi:peptidylprolyl isomerase